MQRAAAFLSRRITGDPMSPRFDTKSGEWILPGPPLTCEWVAAIGIAMTVISTALTVYSQQQQGELAKAQGDANLVAAKEQQNAADNQAAQLNIQAGQERAAAQQSAANKLYEMKVVQSRAAAIAGASGGTTTDPGVVGIQGELGTRGEYNALSDLYTGESRASAEEYQANLAKITGQQQLAAGQFSQQGGSFRAGLANVQSAGTIIGAVGSLYGKYGMGSGAGGSGAMPSDASYPGYG